MFIKWDTGQEINPIFVSNNEELPCKVEKGRYHVLVFDWEEDWRKFGPAFNISNVDISPEQSKIITFFYNKFINSVTFFFTPYS